MTRKSNEFEILKYPLIKVSSWGIEVIIAVSETNCINLLSILFSTISSIKTLQEVAELSVLKTIVRYSNAKIHFFTKA